MITSNPSKLGANPYVGPRPFETGRPIFGRNREIEDLYDLLSAERIVLLYSPSGAGKSSLIQAGLLPQLIRRFDVWGPTRVNLHAPADLPGDVNRYVRSAILGFEQGLPEARRRSEEQLARLSLTEYVQGRPRKRSAPENIVLLFDQFEEVLTTDPLAIEAKREFFRQLGDLLLDRRIWALFALREDYLAPLDPYAEQVPTHLKNRFRLDLLGLEAAAEAITNPALEAGRECAPEAVEKLVHDLATMKVQQPDGAFVDQVGHHVEPLQLQVVCRRLWDRMPETDPRIDLEDVNELGDVTDALSGYYAGEVARIADGDVRLERALREWCGEKLITRDGIRGQVLRGAGQSEGLANDRIARLVDTHLVRGEQRAGAVWYELAHDRLIEPVRNDNRDWFDAHLHKVQKVATLWEAQGRPEGLLLLGAELIEAKQWAAHNESSLTPIERKFLEASTAKQEAIEKEEQQTRRLRQFAAAMVGLALLAIAATGVAFYSKRNADAQRLNADAQRLIAEKQKQRALHAEADALEEAQNARKEKADKEYERGVAEEKRREAEKQTIVATAATAEANKQFEIAESTAYVANMSLATYEFKNHNNRRGFEILDAYLPENSREQRQNDRRDFYWHYLWHQNYRELATLSGHKSPVNSVAFSPDGRILASASGQESREGSPSGDVSIKLWDAKCRGDCLPLATLTGHGDVITSVAFSPDKDTPLLATASVDKTVKLWDANCRKDCKPLVTLHGHEKAVWAVAFSPDKSKSLLASASLDHTIKLWDANCRKDCTPLTTLDDNAPVYAVAFSYDEHKQVLASAGGGQRSRGVNLWDANCRKGCKPLVTLSHEEVVSSVAFSPNDETLASASGEYRPDKGVKLWDANCRKDCKPLETILPLKGRLTSVAFSPNGRTIIAGTTSYGMADNGSVGIWDLATHSNLAVLSIPESSVSAVAFSPDGRTLAGASGQVPIGRSGGNLQLFGENSVKLWFTGNLMERKTSATSLSLFKSLSFSPDKEKPIIATALSFLGVELLDPRSGERLALLTDREGSVNSVAFSANGGTLATANSRFSDSRLTTAIGHAAGDNSIKLWDANCRKDCKPLAKMNGHEKSVTSVAFSPDKDKSLLASASSDGTIKLWNANCRKSCPPLTTLTGHGGGVTAVAFSPDGRMLVSGSDDMTIWLWDANCRKDCKPLAKMKGHGKGVLAVAFSPDKKKPLLASGSLDTTIKLWDVNCRNECSPLITLTGHASGVASMAFSPDGRTLASAGPDKLIKLWDIRSGKELATLNGVNVLSIAFSPDGRTLVSGGGDGRLRFWVGATDGEVEASRPRKKQEAR